MTVVFVALLVFLAAANGGNDVSKGVATLAGARATSYRTAILWGAATTFLGALLSIVVASSMVKLFSSGIVNAAPTTEFAIAVLAATGGWVALATKLTLPVSTTQALVGALVGAGVLLSTSAVQWTALLPKVVQPLLLSVLVAYLVSVTLNGLAASIGRARARHGRVRVPPGGDDATISQQVPAAGPSLSTVSDPTTLVQHDAPEQALRVAHLCSSGATSLARGLNDTPKLVAVGSFALHPAGLTIGQITVMVAVAMTAGALFGGLRLTRRLGEDVVRMSHAEGFRANLVTAALVGLGAQAALPMSTTQVSTSAIAGAAGFEPQRIHLRTVRDFVIGWTVTPAFTATLAWLLHAAMG